MVLNFLFNNVGAVPLRAGSWILPERTTSEGLLAQWQPLGPVAVSLPAAQVHLEIFRISWHQRPF